MKSFEDIVEVVDDMGYSFDKVHEFSQIVIQDSEDDGEEYQSYAEIKRRWKNKADEYESRLQQKIRRHFRMNWLELLKTKFYPAGISGMLIRLCFFTKIFGREFFNLR